LYRIQEFQGKAYVLSDSRRRLRGKEKSLRTTGTVE